MVMSLTSQINLNVSKLFATLSKVKMVICSLFYSVLFPSSI